MCQKINDKRLNLSYYQLNFPSGKELVSNLIERGPKYTACLNLYLACQKSKQLVYLQCAMLDH